MSNKEKELIKIIREHRDPKKALEQAIKIIVEILSPQKPVYVSVTL
jgi:hypothetical protein